MQTASEHVDGGPTERARALRGARAPLVALLAFLVCDLVIWRPGYSLPLTVGVVGSSRSSDYQVMTWSLEWWPWAILHGLNPLHTGLVWAPAGYPTPWMTSIPALALLAAPITLLAGPLVSYNLLMLAAPPAAAFACYLLCRELCHRFWPSLLGGFLFGFSPYVLGQAVAQHLNLVMVWPLPLLALVAVRYYRGGLSSRRAVAAGVGLGLFLLGSSLELFATTVVLGGIMLAITIIFGRGGPARGFSLASLAAVALAIVTGLAAPIIWLTIARSHPPLPYAPEQYATDVANIFVPTPVTFGGTSRAARDVSRHFVGNLGEQNGYLGLPLVAVCLLAAWRDRRRSAWIAGSGVLIALAWSFGPALVIAGRTVVDLPFAMDRVPVLALALPSRLAIFVVLAAICLAVGWLAKPTGQHWRIALGIVVAVSFAPQLGAFGSERAEARAARAALPTFAWEMPRAASGFLRVARRFPPQTTVLALPFGGLSPATFWQAETNMGFRLAGGYTPFAPAATATDPLIEGFLQNAAPPLVVYRLRAYLARTHTGVVLVQSYARSWLRIVGTALHERPHVVAGTAVFTVSGGLLRRLLARPRSQPRRPRGVALAPPGTPSASLTAASGDRVSAVGWLAYDWTTRHVTANAAVRTGAWSRAFELSSPRLEASGLHVAVGGRRSVAAWIEARDGAAALRVAEYRAGHWRRIRLPESDEVTLADTVSVAPNGRVVVAWTAQTGARAVLHVARIEADGRLSADTTLSDAFHSVDGFAISAASTHTVVAWRERDSTETALRAATLIGRAPAWSAPVVLEASGAPGAPRIGLERHGALVVWTSRLSGQDRLEAVRLDRHGVAGAPVALASSGGHLEVGRPSVTRALGGVLVAWCELSRLRVRLHVALVGATAHVDQRQIRGACSHAAPRLLRVGRVTVVNGASRAPRIYVVRPALACSVVEQRKPTGGYRLVAGRWGIDAVTGGGFADSSVVVRALDSAERHARPCSVPTVPGRS